MKLIKLLPAFVGVAILAATILVAGVVIGMRRQIKPKPYDVLGFYPVCKDSPPHLIRAAQGELMRRGYYDYIIDANCGKFTTGGICELLCKLEYEGD